jgi:purine-nucleoside phosphorylase
MSTIQEVLALRQLGVKVGAISCITNLGAGLSSNPLSHAEVESVARATRDRFVAFLCEWIKRLVA